MWNEGTRGDRPKLRMEGQTRSFTDSSRREGAIALGFNISTLWYVLHETGCSQEFQDKSPFAKTRIRARNIEFDLRRIPPPTPRPCNSIPRQWTLQRTYCTLLTLLRRYSTPQMRNRYLPPNQRETSTPPYSQQFAL